MTLTSLDRYTASALHLALSAAIGVAVVLLMLAVWWLILLGAAVAVLPLRLSRLSWIAVALLAAVVDQSGTPAVAME